MSEDMMEQNPKFSCTKTDEELYKMGYERARSKGYTGLRADIYAENYVKGYKIGIEEGVNLLAQAIDKLRAGVPFDDVKAQYGEDIANCAKIYR